MDRHTYANSRVVRNKNHSVCSRMFQNIYLGMALTRSYGTHARFPNRCSCAKAHKKSSQDERVRQGTCRAFFCLLILELLGKGALCRIFISCIIVSCGAAWPCFSSFRSRVAPNVSLFLLCSCSEAARDFDVHISTLCISRKRCQMHLHWNCASGGGSSQPLSSLLQSLCHQPASSPRSDSTVSTTA